MTLTERQMRHMHERHGANIQYDYQTFSIGWHDCHPMWKPSFRYRIDPDWYADWQSQPVQDGDWVVCGLLESSLPCRVVKRIQKRSGACLFFEGVTDGSYDEEHCRRVPPPDHVLAEQEGCMVDGSKPEPTEKPTLTPEPWQPQLGEWCEHRRLGKVMYVGKDSDGCPVVETGAVFQATDFTLLSPLTKPTVEELVKAGWERPEMKELLPGLRAAGVERIGQNVDKDWFYISRSLTLAGSAILVPEHQQAADQGCEAIPVPGTEAWRDLFGEDE